MGPLLVVGNEPAVGHCTNLGQRFKEIRIEHLGTIAAVEAFDKGVVKSRQLQLMPTLRIELFASRIPSIL